MDKNFKPLRSQCPISVSLDVFGDKWTLVIIRDMLVGKTRFSQFLSSPEGIKKNILTSRLRRLESLKIIRREAYQTNPLRYHYLLTASGAQLLPVIQAMGRWTAGHVEGIWSVPDGFYRWTPEMYFNNELGLNRKK